MYAQLETEAGMLQWGRDFSVAEGWIQVLSARTWHIRFNGAATLVSRKGCHDV